MLLAKKYGFPGTLFRHFYSWDIIYRLTNVSPSASLHWFLVMYFKPLSHLQYLYTLTSSAEMCRKWITRLWLWSWPSWRILMVLVGCIRSPFLYHSPETSSTEISQTNTAFWSSWMSRSSRPCRVSSSRSAKRIHIKGYLRLQWGHLKWTKSKEKNSNIQQQSQSFFFIRKKNRNRKEQDACATWFPFPFLKYCSYCCGFCAITYNCTLRANCYCTEVYVLYRKYQEKSSDVELSLT